MSKYILFITFISIVFSAPSCKKDVNFCTKCDVLTNLCIICQNDFLIPDKNGGCYGAKVCEEGRNYCDKCDSKEELCKKCAESLYPDENGGCSYTDNCELSFRGNCIKCIDDYILIGYTDGPKICKSINSEDFENCKSIDYTSGKCLECEEDYFLNFGDKKCIETENCYESVYGKCISCNVGYYLDHKSKNVCKEVKKEFSHCRETEDGKKCSKCDGGYYFDEEGKCVSTNFCSQSENYICTKCKEDYLLTENRRTCSKTKNCYNADPDSGACISCSRYFYLDVNDKRKCKSNQEDDDDLKFCTYFDEKCISCENNYNLDADGKCAGSVYCLKSDNGICKKCQENFYLGLDNKCTSVNHCTYSDNYNACLECEEGYYYNQTSLECLKADKDFEGCKITDGEGKICEECFDDYYITKNDGHCYPNDKEGALYKCSVTNENGTECVKCRKGFYLGSKDKKCTEIEGCAIYSEGKGVCKECDKSYCLDLKKGSCENNMWVDDEKKKFYYKCLVTNEEGTKCEECEEGNEVGKNGLCIDENLCEKTKDGKCVKCKEGGEDLMPFSFCVNNDFGCVENYENENCLRCDNNLDFDNCTECKEGYQLSKSAKWDGYFECIILDEDNLK